MKPIFAISILALALPAIAAAQTQTAPQNETAPAQSGAVQGMTAAPADNTPGAMAQTLSAQDKLFIKKAAYSGLSEVSDGQLAESKGGASVQKVATQMVTDHSKANDQLASLSQSLGDPAPTATDAKHLKIHTALAGLSGAAFDAKYLKTQLQGHEMTIAAFQAEINSGANPQLKQFASQTLPILKMHLSMIKSAVQPGNG